MTRSQGLCSGAVGPTLTAMIIIWVCCLLNFQITELYIQYIPVGTYICYTISGCADIAANLTTGLIFRKVGPKVCYLIGFGLSLIGGFMLIFMDRYPDNLALIATAVCLAKFGAGVAQCTCYIATPWVFPLIMCGTAFAICNVFGRIGQATASFISEME